MLDAQEAMPHLREAERNASTMDLNDLERTTGFPIQSAIWPEPDISTEPAPHFRMKGPVGLSLTDGGADFGPGGRLNTSAYYNLFNLGKWRKYCGEVPLELQLTGRGRFVLSIRVAGTITSVHQIFTETIELDGFFRQPIVFDDLRHSPAVLFFELTALDNGRLDDFAWATSMRPRTQPHLALSITTFRREDEVARTVERFRDYRSHSPLRDQLSMFVVDNGGTVSLDDGDGVAIISNENLGGSGGFTRGMLAAKEAGATHCLFMDDDAAIQMEAISRTWWFLAYALDPRTAVAGGMINAAYRWQVWENGARFDRGCIPNYHRLDLRKRRSVFQMEYETTATPPADFYAGWWFFAFPIAQAEHLPFPFFVRGDDVSFSLVNDFKIVTLPGVASIQESFTDKASPQTWYLDFRSHLVHHLTGAAKRRSWSELQKMVISFYLRNVLRFHYDTLSAVNLAFEDVMRGPGFFDDNADMAQRRADIKALTTSEAWQPLESTPSERLGRFPRPLRALWLLMLNGHLAPFSSRLGSKLTLSAPYREDYRKTYGAAQITYLDADGTAAYTVHRDRKRFRTETVRLVKNSLRLRRMQSQLRQKWTDGYDAMTSDAYWANKLGLSQQDR